MAIVVVETVAEDKAVRALLIGGVRSWLDGASGRNIRGRRIREAWYYRDGGAKGTHTRSEGEA